jgi:hypothetical protein
MQMRALGNPHGRRCWPCHFADHDRTAVLPRLWPEQPEAQKQLQVSLPRLCKQQWTQLKAQKLLFLRVWNREDPLVTPPFSMKPSGTFEEYMEAYAELCSI